MSARPARSTALAYVLWFFLGGFGAHRFYLGKAYTAAVQMFLSVGGTIFLSIGVLLGRFVSIIGGLMLVAFAVFWIVDAFLIPGLVRSYDPAKRQRLPSFNGDPYDTGPMNF